ncbi:hypothetical protein [Ferrimonas marina]|uniref:PAS domain-containing protein n=1 Tax=Ferrimonas marina TaxID=299255 RepID=A0A1M5YTY5_9GAMM|nr:hypothetical protein [Ferrimonas marina]SHI15369.1 hypothetical protein SAMN02745129_4425 [Ferrimonas marina]
MSEASLASIFHPSGNPSLLAIRELLPVIPAAVAVIDMESGQVLAVSPSAMAMFGVDTEGLYYIQDFYCDPTIWPQRLHQLRSQSGLIAASSQVRDIHGNEFPSFGRMQRAVMAGREVAVVSMEKGFHYRERCCETSVACYQI